MMKLIAKYGGKLAPVPLTPVVVFVVAVATVIPVVLVAVLAVTPSDAVLPEIE